MIRRDRETERGRSIGGKLRSVKTAHGPWKLVAGIAGFVVFAAGCGRTLYDPAKATRPYPAHLHRADSVDVQVFREGTNIELVNATARSYRDFDLWINQRYVAQVDALPAGETVRLSLRGFRDERGEQLNAGGFWRTKEPTPVRLVQIQLADDQPMIGLVTIRAEEVDISARR